MNIVLADAIDETNATDNNTMGTIVCECFFFAHIFNDTESVVII